MIFAEARGSTDEKKKTNFFVWKRNKEKKTTKTFATICALYVYVCTEVFLFTVKWPFIIMEKRDLFLYSNNKNLHRIAKKKRLFFLFWRPCSRKSFIGIVELSHSPDPFRREKRFFDVFLLLGQHSPLSNSWVRRPLRSKNSLDLNSAPFLFGCVSMDRYAGRRYTV